MPAPQLALPPAPETAAFRAVVRVLQSDPTLNRLVGRNWRAWDGSATDLLEPTASTCPHLAISPTPGPSGRETEGQHKSDMLVQIELHTSGTDADQLMNFWHAVRKALFPDPGTDRHDWVRKAMQDARVVDGTLVRSAYGSVVDGEAPVMLYAAGVLKLVLLVDA